MLFPVDNSGNKVDSFNEDVVVLHRALSLPILGALASFSVLPQAVISTHSGLVNFVDGSVSIDSQPISEKPGKFASLKEGSTLQTGAGRAEVLLTPDVILRVGANSAVRMVSNSFADTRVAFLSGSAILESGESADTPVTILYRDYEVQSRENSTYRFDSESPGLTVLKGKAKVSLNTQSLVIGKDHAMQFTGALHAQEPGDRADDALDRWAKERDQALAADSEAVGKTTDDLSVAEAWQDGSGLADPYAGLSFSSPGSLQSPYGISPNSQIGSIYAVPASPLNLYSTNYSYPTLEQSLPYPVAFYLWPVIVRSSRHLGINPVLPFGSRPGSGISPIWRPRVPAAVGMPLRPPVISRPLVTRPPMIAAPHVTAGHR
jgi:hypothetical protein